MRDSATIDVRHLVAALILALVAVMPFACMRAADKKVEAKISVPAKNLAAPDAFLTYDDERKPGNAGTWISSLLVASIERDGSVRTRMVQGEEFQMRDQ